MRVLWYRPIVDAFRQTWGAVKRLFGSLNDTDLLKEAIRSGRPTAIFLTKSKGLFYTNTEALDLLVEPQKDLKQPIQLVPVLAVWQ